LGQLARKGACMHTSIISAARRIMEGLWSMVGLLPAVRQDILGHVWRLQSFIGSPVSVR
jgi:hypothetical protein